jgi:hypothetical protein
MNENETRKRAKVVASQTDFEVRFVDLLTVYLKVKAILVKASKFWLLPRAWRRAIIQLIEQLDVLFRLGSNEV